MTTRASDLRVALARTPGRPSRLTSEVAEEFFKAIAEGCDRSTAAQSVGLSPRTVEGWVARGRGLDPDRSALPEYVNFVTQMDRVEATHRRMIVRVVTSEEVLRQHPEIARWWLAVHDPEHYGAPRSDRLTDNPEDLLRLPKPIPEPTVEMTETHRTLSIPLDQLGDFAKRVITIQRGIPDAPIGGRLSVGPDDDNSEE